MKRKPARETREQLLAKRSELWERLEAIRRDYAGGLDRDMDEQSIQLENEEVLAELSREAVEQLKEIERKLSLLENPEQRGLFNMKKSARQRQEERVDEALRESFPASDPPAIRPRRLP